jgi:hypothetical protein
MVSPPENKAGSCLFYRKTAGFLMMFYGSLNAGHDPGVNINAE